MFYLILTPMADWQLHYTTNVMILTLQSSVFIFFAVIHHFHLLMVCISHSWFDTQEQVLCMRTLQNETIYWQKWLMLQGYNESRLKSSFRKFYGRSNYTLFMLFVITNYHWPICWMICFILLGVSILCWPVTPLVGMRYTGLPVVKASMEWQSNKLYETSHSAYVPVMICNRKQSHYNDRRICEMMTLNEIHYNLSTSTFL
jgi:hypothetical protein